MSIKLIRDEITPHLEKLSRNLQSASHRQQLEAALNQEHEMVERERRLNVALRTGKLRYAQQVPRPHFIHPALALHAIFVRRYLQRPALPCIPGEHMLQAAQSRLDRIVHAHVERLLRG